jgi:hypothetical protein
MWAIASDPRLAVRTRGRVDRCKAAPNRVFFVVMGVGVRLWIAVVATLALGVGAFISIAAVGQIHHENGCSQYHNALVATTDDLKVEQKPNAEILNILTPNERNKVTEGLRSEEQAIKKHPNEAALIRGISAAYFSSLVPSALAEYGC